MKIDVTKVLEDLNGKPIMVGQQECPTCGQPAGEISPLTLRLVAIKALTASYEDERSLGGEEKVKRFHLALRLHDDDEPDLKPEDVVLAKKLIGKLFGPLVVGQSWIILDGDSPSEEEE